MLISGSTRSGASQRGSLAKSTGQTGALPLRASLDWRAQAEHRGIRRWLGILVTPAFAPGALDPTDDYGFHRMALLDTEEQREKPAPRQVAEGSGYGDSVSLGSDTDDFS